MAETRADYDGAWKEVVERFFEPFVSFFFPRAHAGIDWTMGYEFLDKDLRQVVRDAELGRRLADKLVKVRTGEGEEAWVLVHIEVQGDVEGTFAKRMYVYNYRIFDRYDRRVASLAVLADSLRGWRPDGYGYELWGCKVGIQFPAIKLLDYEARWSELEQSENPFAIIVMTHLKARATRRDAQGRLIGSSALLKCFTGKDTQEKTSWSCFASSTGSWCCPKSWSTVLRKHSDNTRRTQRCLMSPVSNAGESSKECSREFF